MTIDEKITFLRQEIDRSVLPLIKSDYVLYSLPYYSNIGDILIWEGARDMLRNVPYKCKGVCSWNEYPLTPPAKGTTILIMGGGFFGDVWRWGWKFVLDGLKGCEDYPIIILPQSIHYEDEATMRQDADYMARFKHLTICARDAQSLTLARQHFANNSILVPDMAFHINVDSLKKYMRPATGKTLYLKRGDKELGTGAPDLTANDRLDIRDWPTIESELPWTVKFQRTEQRLRKIRHKNGRPRAIALAAIHWMYAHRYRPGMIKCGVEFISSYKDVITTRLHVMILALLLKRPVRFIDNSYGKNKALYDTWLSDCPTSDIRPL